MSDLPSWVKPRGTETPQPQQEALPSWVKPREQAQQEPYSARELYQFAPDFRNYYDVMFGEDTSDLSDEEVADKFLRRRRLVLSNSVTAAQEIATLTSLMDNEEALSKIGGAYAAFEGMEPLFGGEGVTAGEKLGGVGTYLAGTIFDPVNAIGGILGKSVARGGSKVVLQTAERAAQAAFRKKLEKTGSREAAEAVMNKVYQRSAREINRKAMEETGTQTVSSAWKKLGTRAGLKEVGTVTAVDAVSSLGIELGYQKGMQLTGLQDEYDSTALGIVALGTAFIGGVSAGTVMRSGSKTFSLAENPNLIEDVTKSFKMNRRDSGRREGVDKWVDKWSRGKKISELDDEFWVGLIKGDEESGMVGLLQVLKDNGYKFKPRYANEPVSNQIADFFAKMGDDKHQELLKFFEEDMGIVMDKAPKQTAKEFADTFARKMHNAAQLMNMASQVAKTRGIKESEVTNEMVINYLLGTDPPPYLSKVMTKPKDHTVGVMAELSREFMRFQNNTIRSLVGSLATSAVNVVGWTAAETIQTLSDASIAGMHAGIGALGKIAKTKSADEQLRMAAQIGANIRTKFSNMMDMGMTIDQFRSLERLFPDQMAELTHVLPGGVENITELMRKNRINPVETVIGRGAQWSGDKAEKLVDIVHKATLVEAQDVYTKAFTFMGQLDKEFRLRFNKPLKEYLDDPISFNRLSNSEEFKAALAKANETTQEMIFSKSYANRGKHSSGVAYGVFEIAEMIEKARDLPVIGLLVPFGRFFNNTVAFTANNTGVGLAAKFISGGKFNASKSYEELMMRGVITAGLVASMVPGEIEAIEEGRGIYDLKMPDGSTIDTRFMFPAPLYKGLAHIVARKAVGEGLTNEEIKDLSRTNAVWKSMSAAFSDGLSYESWLQAFGKDQLPEGMTAEFMKTVYGQLTRELVASGDGVSQVLDDALNGRADITELLSASLGKSLGTFGSAWTRSYEPVDLLVAQINGTDYSTIDRKELGAFASEFTRYFPYSMEIVTGEALPRKQSASRGKVPASSLAKFAGLRQLPPQTNIEKILNRLGREHYLLSEYSNSVPAYANRFNQLFFSMSEKRAGELWSNQRFQTLSIPQQQEIWDAEVTRIGGQVKSLMRSKLEETNDRQLVMAFDLISDHGSDTVTEAMKVLNMQDFKFEELNTSQLNQIDLLLKGRKSLNTTRMFKE